MKPRGVLLDKDGTLFHFGAMWEPAYREGATLVAAAAGDPTLAERLLAATGFAAGSFRPGSLLACGSNAEIVAAWTALAGVGAEALGQAVLAAFETHAGRPVPLVDLGALLDALRARGLAVGVATGDTTAGARAGLAAAGVLDRVDLVLGSDAGAGTKPEPGMVLAFAAALGLPPAAIAVVGDSAADLEMARRAGAGHAVGVLSGTGSREDLEPLAHVLLDHVGMLPGWIDATA